VGGVGKVSVGGCLVDRRESRARTGGCGCVVERLSDRVRGLWKGGWADE